MTKEANGSGPELIVLGRDENGDCRAGRFSADQANLVAKAAKAMNLTVCKIASADLAHWVKHVQLGRLYAAGRASVPPVRPSLYEKIVEQLRLSGQQVPHETPETANEAPPELPSSWGDIAVGNLVIAQESRAAGWWEAIVLARDGDMLTLQWVDYPRWPQVVRHADSIALMKPGPANSA